MKSRAFVTLLVVPVVSGALAASPTPPPPPVHRQVISDELEEVTGTGQRRPSSGASAQSGETLCPPASPTAVPDGQPIVVTLRPAPPFTVGSLTRRDWTNPPVTNPTWRLWWYSFRWMPPLMRRAVADGQRQSVAVLLDQLLRYYREYPDPGWSLLGWDEGASLRRLEVLNCLYDLTRDSRLVGAMQSEAAVQFGPRYYGPPRYMVHNHGLMANLAVIDAGRLIGRDDWVTRASARVRAEMGLAFTPLGTTYEQSAGYQGYNIPLWVRARDTLAQISPRGANDPDVVALQGIIARAIGVLQWLTEPDGRYVLIGNTTLLPGAAAPHRTTAGAFRDDVAGFGIGRWSWSNPATTYYTVRYGPPRMAHGRFDKGAVTWSAAGARILVGAGSHGNDSNDALVRWQNTPDAYNVAFPVGAALRRNPMRVTAATIGQTRHSWRLTSNVYVRAHTRTVDVDHPGRLLSVSDTFSGTGEAHQVWHLDPAWRLVAAPDGSRVMRFRHPRGHTLEMRTTGRLLTPKRGATNPVAGWNFPAAGVSHPSWELRVGWSSGRVLTTFRLGCGRAFTADGACSGPARSGRELT